MSTYHPLRIVPAPGQAEDAVTAARGLDREGYPGHDHAVPDDPADYHCMHQTFIPRLAEREAEALAASVDGAPRRYDDVLYRSMDEAVDTLEHPYLLVGGYDPDEMPDDPAAVDPEAFDVDDRYRERELLLTAEVEADDELLGALQDAVNALPYDVLGWDVAGDAFDAFTRPKPAIDQLGDARIGIHAHVAARGLDNPAVVGVPSGRHPRDGDVHVTMTDDRHMFLTPDTMDDRERDVYDDIVDTLDVYGLEPV